MPTLNTSKTGVGLGQSSTTFATARQNGSSVTSNPGGTFSTAIQYTGTSGRGSLTHNIRRTFLYFDTFVVFRKLLIFAIFARCFSFAKIKTSRKLESNAILFLFICMNTKCSLNDIQLKNCQSLT